jgi:hypothetical protein
MFVAFFNFGCSESEPIKIGGKPKIYQLENPNTFFTDTLSIYGENLGLMQDSSYLMINDTLRISSYDCLKWTNSRIDLIVPKLPMQSTFYVVVDAQKIMIDKDNYYQNITVSPYPPFSTVLINSGSFEMGSAEFGIADEMPVHLVQLTRNILVATCQITQRLYSTIMDENPSEIKGNDLPVYNVSWLDAIIFCNKLSEEDGLKQVYTILPNDFVSFDTDANGWRLPTEAEWEYFSQVDISNDFGNDELSKFAWFANNSGLQPHAVGKLQPNSFGLYDVLGNVWEWCWDYYRADYYSISPLVNPLGPQNGTVRVMRGGSCDDGKILVRTQSRTTPSQKTKIGFRIVRTY